MDIRGALVELHLTPQGERALQEYVSGARFSAYVRDQDAVGILIASEARPPAEEELEWPWPPWPSLLVKWDYIETLRIMYSPPEGADEALPV